MAIDAAQTLAKVGANSPEGARLVKQLASLSTQGSGNRVVIGKWIEGAGYVVEARKNGGIYYETAEGVWDALGQNRDLAWAVNEQFLRNQLESGIGKVELFGETIEEVLRHRPDSFTAKEIVFLKKEALKYGYMLQGNSWVKIK